MKTWLVLALAAAPAAAAPATLDGVVTQLAGMSCPSVTRLSPALGTQTYTPKKDEMANLAPLPLDVSAVTKLGIRKATAHVLIDIYHQTPSTVTDPMVGELELELEPAVTFKLPNATSYTVGTDTVSHAGSLFWSATKHQLSMMCGSNRPAWAQQAWTPDAVKDATAKALAALSGKGADSSDERSEIKLHADYTSVTFKTPLPAAQLLAAVGAKAVTLKAVDVHMSHWVLYLANGKPIEYAGQRLEFSVDDTDLDKLALKGKPLDIGKLRLTYLNARKP